MMSCTLCAQLGLLLHDIAEKEHWLSPRREALPLVSGPPSPGALSRCPPQVLSGLLLGPDKYLQRVAAVSPSGEECVLNVTMTASMPPPLASPLPPQQETPAMTPLSSVDDCTSSNSSSSTPAAATEGPGSSGVKPVWRLSCVRGEPAVRGDGLEGPSPELPPEVVVEQQLAAMQ